MQYCHETGDHQCLKLPLPCLKECGDGSIPCEDMEAHRKECPFEMIQCEYHNVGCEVRIARKDQDKHKKEKIEEDLMRTKVVLTDELNSTKLELTITKHELTDSKGI